MRIRSGAPIAIAGMLLALPLSAQRLQLTENILHPTAGVYITDMDLVQGARGLMSGYASNNLGPGDPSVGFITSISLDTCTWADGDYVNWSRTLADTNHLRLGDSVYVRLDGTVRGCTAFGSPTLAVCGSTGWRDRDAMVAMLFAQGDTIWTTSLRASAGNAWFTQVQRGLDGTVYCVGSLRDSTNTTDVVFARFLSTGQLMWYRRLALPGTNDDGLQCLVNLDTLLVFSTIGDIPGTDTTNESDIAVLRISSAGDLIDGHVLDIPDDFGFGDVVRDGADGYFLCTSVHAGNPLYNNAACGLIHLDAQLDTVGEPIKVVGLDDVDRGSGKGTSLAFDPVTGVAYIGGAASTGLGSYATFVVAIAPAQAAGLWGRFVEDGHHLFGGIGLSDGAGSVRTLSAQLGSGTTYMNAWEAATGSLGASEDCGYINATWTPVLAPLPVQSPDDTLELTTPEVQVRHGLVFGTHTWQADVCPAPPPPNACSVGLSEPAASPGPLAWPNPAAPGEPVRFAGPASVYDAVGKLVRANAVRITAPEQPGCYVVVAGGRRTVLVVQGD